MKKGKNDSLFGTDGIRSKFGDFPLDSSSIKRIGFSIGSVCGPVRILIGRDTRMSGIDIERLLKEGIGKGSEIFSAGVIPTPGLSYNVSSGSFDLGIMITASHNKWTDNGIKLFGHDGEKLSDDIQDKIGQVFFSGDSFNTSPKKDRIHAYDGNKYYSEYIVSNFSGIEAKGIRVLLDCANGAASEVAPGIFSNLGIENFPFNFSPDGKNINSGCGSTDLGFLKERIRTKNGDLGIAFDGDGDRVLMVDSSGREIDGDQILFVISKFLTESDPDFNPKVVGTVMSNLALERSLKSSGIEFFRSDVGDRNVYEKMKQISSVLGGEQSGHIIYSDVQKTGDGILTSLLFLKALNFLGVTVPEAGKLYHPSPQVTKSLRIREKKDLESWEELNSMIEEFYHEFGNNSRILIRYSGTEKKIRLMIESEEDKVINKNIEIFERFLISEIGEE